VACVRITPLSATSKAVAARFPLRFLFAELKERHPVKACLGVKGNRSMPILKNFSLLDDSDWWRGALRRRMPNG
jgi:hypothetical protein